MSLYSFYPCNTVPSREWESVTVQTGHGMLLFTPTPPRGVFTRFLRDKPEGNLRETAVLRFLCMRYWSRSEQ